MKYPFTPEILDALPEEIADLFRELENTLLDEICTRLNLSGQLNEVTVRAIRVLRAHGIGMDDIKKAIKKTTGITEKKLDELLDGVVKRNEQYYDEVITLADVTRPEVLVDAATIEAIKKQVQREFGNLTRSMGFLVDSGRTMLEPAKAYQWALDKAALQVESGAISYNQAIRYAVKELAESGIKTVDYESGHIDSIDVAARRAVMTGVNQINQQYREQSMDYLETDLVEVTAHYGARNIGDVPENHEKWQGKVYRWSEKPQISTGEYPDFVEICGYGLGEGIGGWNCRHSYWPFIEGVSERTYTDKQLEAMKGVNNKVTFDGKEYDGYQATQMQRRLERQIRKQKRLVNSYKAAGLKEDTDAAKIKLNRLETKYKEFSKAAGLPEQIERKNVGYLPTDEKSDAVAQALKVQRESETARAAEARNAVRIRETRAEEAEPKTQSVVADSKYIDVTTEWVENANPNSHTVQDLTEYTVGDVTYTVDGHNVVLDYSAHEKEIAELLEQKFGGELYMVPRVNNPQGVSTPDYLFRGNKYDLKTIMENAGENTLFNRVKKAKGQAERFVIDVTESGLSDDVIGAQVQKMFEHNGTDWVEEIIVIRGEQVVCIVKRA